MAGDAPLFIPLFFCKKTGFTLIELSIVLVIIGLIVGGVLVGRDLIRASELRSVITQHQQFLTAIHRFRDIYGALPGDMANATSYWGQASNCNGSAITSGTCNGDGRGWIGPIVANGADTETSFVTEGFRAWYYLAAAGLISGKFTQSNLSFVPGDNVPAGKISNSYWWIRTAILCNFSSVQYNGHPDCGWHNGFVFSALGDAYPLTPEEAWNIDKKIDDGMASDGQVIGYPRNATGNGCGASNYWPSAYHLARRSDKLCNLFFMF